jgi:hypothetical protein
MLEAINLNGQALPEKVKLTKYDGLLNPVDKG